LRIILFLMLCNFQISYSLQPSKVLIKHLIRQEGLILKAIPDFNGQPIIGYSHHDKNIKLGDSITKKEAVKLLRKDLRKISTKINKTGTKLTQQQFDILCSLLYNIGTFSGSDTYKLILKSPNNILIKDKIKEYCYARDKKGHKIWSNNLFIRHYIEAEYYFSK
jgi:GH24 family phage-related lysozyme (muramidase)